MEDVFFLRPVFKQCVWGGERLKTVFAYNIPGSQTGECWGVSVHANGDCEKSHIVTGKTYCVKFLFKRGTFFK